MCPEAAQVGCAGTKTPQNMPGGVEMLPPEHEMGQKHARRQPKVGVRAQKRPKKCPEAADSGGTGTKTPQNVPGGGQEWGTAGELSGIIGKVCGKLQFV